MPSHRAESAPESDPIRVPSGFSITVPDWVHSEVADIPRVIESLDDRMHLVHRLARRNVEEGTGGPFAAVICEESTGTVVSVGVNLVLASGLSSMHAEVVAISLAQTAVGAWDLGGEDTVLQMVVNGRPCAMCYGSVVWSGLRALATSVEGHEIEEITGFDEGPVTPDWQAELERRGISVTRDVQREESLELYRWYRDRADAGGSLVYNARGQSESGRAATAGPAD